MSDIIIKETTYADIEDIMYVESKAFGYDKEAELTKDLLNDPTAQPSLSLLAFQDKKPVGHILFTKVSLIPNRDGVKASILAPLAVIPEAQKQRIGGKLIKKGLEILEKSGIKLVFCLGHPTYYPRYGFIPAFPKGFVAPYPIPKKHHDAWMLQFLGGYNPTNASEKVACAKKLDKPEHWRE